MCGYRGDILGYRGDIGGDRVMVCIWGEIGVGWIYWGYMVIHWDLGCIHCGYNGVVYRGI